jgi:hypothetical protein
MFKIIAYVQRQTLPEEFHYILSKNSRPRPNLTTTKPRTRKAIFELYELCKLYPEIDNQMMLFQLQDIAATYSNTKETHFNQRYPIKKSTQKCLDKYITNYRIYFRRNSFRLLSPLNHRLRQECLKNIHQDLIYFLKQAIYELNKALDFRYLPESLANFYDFTTTHAFLRFRLSSEDLHPLSIQILNDPREYIRVYLPRGPLDGLLIPVPPYPKYTIVAYDEQNCRHVLDIGRQ